MPEPNDIDRARFVRISSPMLSDTPGVCRAEHDRVAIARDVHLPHEVGEDEVPCRCVAVYISPRTVVLPPTDGSRVRAALVRIRRKEEDLRGREGGDAAGRNMQALRIGMARAREMMEEELGL